MALWRQMKTGRQSRRLWGGVLIGWIFWAVAESLWATYSLLGQDPYPSWADFFFLSGYIPMSVGFLSRIWGLPKKLDMSQRSMVWVVSLVIIAITTFFIFIPILQNYDPRRLLESLLSIFYPLADLFLLILVLYLLFTYGPGDYGSGWRLILFGFVMVTISDLFFSYADWNGLYYPDSKATLISTLAVDLPYNVSYVLWALGIYALHILLREHRTLKIDLRPKLVPNAHIFVFTKKDETVIEVSRNYHHLFPLNDEKGRSLAEVLGISKQQESILHEKLLSTKSLTDEPILIAGPMGALQEGWLCGLAITNPQNEYSGANLLLRTFVEGKEIDDGLSEYEKSLLSHVLTKCNSNEKNEIKQLLLDYYLAYIKSLFNFAFQEGGAGMSSALLDEMQMMAQKRGWYLKLNPQTILDGESASLDSLREALPVLLESAKRFAAQLTDSDTVEAELQSISLQFSESIHKNVAYYSK
jgi:hypothetical protein